MTLLCPHCNHPITEQVKESLVYEEAVVESACDHCAESFWIQIAMFGADHKYFAMAVYIRTREEKEEIP